MKSLSESLFSRKIGADTVSTLEEYNLFNGVVLVFV